MEEKDVMVLSPIGVEHVVPNSIVTVADCGHECWVAPGSWAKYMSGEVITKCIDCFGGEDAVKAAIAGGTAKINAKEVLEEMRRMRNEGE